MKEIKKKYERPCMKVYETENYPQLLAGSGTADPFDPEDI
ncbi:hypothetical protein SAMN04487850_0662 [Prevotella aff. ruminicola Tc2-24]|jgi:hypothetical protein|uniref:Uncharacterized protein n=1 Tax=Prevotella aff. ruminicola Tc2-24 TaxID=81582 RepID=A0A1I0MH89_9BACT|nr:hypothetical protein SAMN04487828_0665 [Prevotella sp. lc2012]SEV87679.1 hypothetical protein SAMN04487850_0662 [Prevotella aff. ruminicola Tc2-24]